jgi:hypothetical protein
VFGKTVPTVDENRLAEIFANVDDSRAELDFYGYDRMQTPSFDRLARRSMQWREKIR